MVKKDSTGKRLNADKSFCTDTWCGYIATLATYHVHALTRINYMKNTTLLNCSVYGCCGSDQELGVSLSDWLALTCYIILIGRGIILVGCAFTHL